MTELETNLPEETFHLQRDQYELMQSSLRRFLPGMKNNYLLEKCLSL